MSAKTNPRPRRARPLADLDLRALHEQLLAIHGPQRPWWPGTGSFAMPVSAILVQRVTWQQAETALCALEDAGLTDPVALAEASPEQLIPLIRPSGFMTAKAVALQGLARWELEHLDVTGVADGELRASLLAIRGVGPETADAIALYAFARPMFIADAYARRLFEQEGFTVPGGYEPFRQALRPALEQAALIAAPEAAADLAELHGLIVEEGRRRAGRPQTYLRTTRAGA